MRELCRAYHLPATVLAQHLTELWKIVAHQLLDEFSLITPINAGGRRTMARDVEYLIAEQKKQRGAEPIPADLGLPVLLEYINAYFYELPQLLQFSKEQIQINISHLTLKRLYAVHPCINPKPDTQSSQKEEDAKLTTVFKDWFNRARDNIAV